MEAQTPSHSATVGVLALQGAVSEHLYQLKQLQVNAIAIKEASQLANIDGLILPGGESTAIAHLMQQSEFMPTIVKFALHKPILGTCAGMILLAKNIIESDVPTLSLMDITVKRNAFGRQVDSFQAPLTIRGLSTPFPGVFIRAPYISKVDANKVEVLANYGEHIVLAKQGKLLACSFHPELTQDTRVMQLFLDML